MFKTIKEADDGFDNKLTSIKDFKTHRAAQVQKYVWFV